MKTNFCSTSFLPFALGITVGILCVLPAAAYFAITSARLQTQAAALQSRAVQKIRVQQSEQANNDTLEAPIGASYQPISEHTGKNEELALTIAPPDFPKYPHDPGRRVRFQVRAVSGYCGDAREIMLLMKENKQ